MLKLEGLKDEVPGGTDGHELQEWYIATGTM